MPISRSSSGFTLLEVLLTTTILVLVLVLFAQIISHTSQAITGTTKRIETDADARTALGLMTRDLRSMIHRPDVPCSLIVSNGNDEIYFYAEAPAKSSGTASNLSGVSRIGYRVTTNGLERYSEVLSWTALPFGTGNNSAAQGLNPAGYDSICGQTFALEIAVLLTTGTLTTVIPTNAQGTDWSQVQGIVITTANTDWKSKRNGSITRSSTFVDTTPNATQPVGMEWAAATATLNGNLGLKNADDARSVRVYERVIPIQ